MPEESASSPIWPDSLVQPPIREQARRSRTSTRRSARLSAEDDERIVARMATSGQRMIGVDTNVLLRFLVNDDPAVKNERAAFA